MSALFKWLDERPGPQLGDVRYVRRFLLLPKLIGVEWRWLGREEIKQQYRQFFDFCPDMPGGGCEVVGWVDMEWAE